MRITRLQLAAALTAIALVAGGAAPAAFAKGSGFSGGRSSFSSSSSSSRSYSSPSVSRSVSYDASPARASGFVSTGTGRAAATTSLGSTLSAAHASRDAATTLNARQSSASGSSNAGSAGSGYGATGSYAAGTNAPAPSYNAPTYSAPAPVPQTVVVHQSGNDGFFLGWLLGHDSAPRETVMVQQATPATVQSGPDGSSGYQGAQAGFNAPAQGAAPASSAVSGGERATPTLQQAVKPPGSAVLKVVVWLLGIGGAAWLVVSLFKGWAARKARFTSKTNYRL